jgi:hypothetical protein
MLDPYLRFLWQEYPNMKMLTLSYPSERNVNEVLMNFFGLMVWNFIHHIFRKDITVGKARLDPDLGFMLIKEGAEYTAWIITGLKNTNKNIFILGGD